MVVCEISERIGMTCAQAYESNLLASVQVLAETLLVVLTPTGTTGPRAYTKKLLLVEPLVAPNGYQGSLAHAVRINGV